MNEDKHLHPGIGPPRKEAGPDLCSCGGIYTLARR